MDKSDTFILILHTKKFIIPSSFRTLEDVDQSVYYALITNHQYEVKSSVNESVLESFIDNWINQSIPKINLGNFSQYEELSQEFDRMNDIIKLCQITIQNEIISKFKMKTQVLMKRIKNTNIVLHQQINQYQQSIKFIFSDTNYNNIIHDINSKNELYLKIFFESKKFLELILYECIEIDDIIFILDKIAKTAGVFSSKTDAELIVIPKSIFYKEEEYLIIEICQAAFQYSLHLKTIQFSDDSELQIINKFAFINTMIENLEIPSSVVELKKGWCSSTSFLNHISVRPNNKRYIYFNNQFILGKSDQNSNVYDILVFSRRDIVEALIPSFIKIIDKFSFECCEQIEKVEFTKSSELKIIEKLAFASSFIESIIIPNHVTHIKSMAFSECKFLKDVQFQENSELQTIGSSAFECDSISSITIPSQVKEIKGCAFANCANLTKFEFEENSQLESIELNAIAFNPIENISIPSEFVELKDGWCREAFVMNKVSLNPKNKRYTYFNQYLVGKSDLDSEVYDVLVFAPRNIKFVKIPSFVKIIGQFAFDRCDIIYNIDFDDDSQLELIDFSAFSSSSIEKIKIPDTVKKIGKKAFSDCPCLNTVILSNNSQLQEIKNAAFFNSALTSFEIPPNVTKIESETFCSCEYLQIIEISEDSKLSSLNRNLFDANIHNLLMIPVKLHNSLKII